MFMVRKETISLKYSFVFHLGTMKNTHLKCLWKDAPVCSVRFQVLGAAGAVRHSTFSFLLVLTVPGRAFHYSAF